jgi:hypothetical protein
LLRLRRGCSIPVQPPTSGCKPFCCYVLDPSKLIYPHHLPLDQNQECSLLLHPQPLIHSCPPLCCLNLPVQRLSCSAPIILLCTVSCHTPHWWLMLHRTHYLIIRQVVSTLFLTSQLHRGEDSHTRGVKLIGLRSWVSHMHRLG